MIRRYKVQSESHGGYRLVPDDDAAIVLYTDHEADKAETVDEYEHALRMMNGERNFWFERATAAEARVAELTRRVEGLVGKWEQWALTVAQNTDVGHLRRAETYDACAQELRRALGDGAWDKHKD